MALNTWGNTWERNDENAEQQKNKKTYNELYKEYVKSEMNKATSSKKAFIQLLKDEDTITVDLFNKMKAFAWAWEWFDDLELKGPDSLNIWALQREMQWSFITLDNSRKNVKTYILQNYDITSKDFDIKIWKKSDFIKLWAEDLQKMLEKESDVIKCLKALYKSDPIPERRDVLNFLEKANLPEKIQQKMKNSNPEEKKKLESLIWSFYSFGLTRGDFEDILRYDFLNENEKEILLQCFVPFVSIDTVKEMGLLSEDEIKKYKLFIIESSQQSTGLSNWEKQELSSTILDKDIKIPIEDILKKKPSQETINTLLSVWLEKNIANTLDDIRKQKLSESPKTFEEFHATISLMSDISQKIKNLDKMILGSFIDITMKSEWLEKKSALKITEINKSIHASDRGLGIEEYCVSNVDWKDIYSLTNSASHQSYADLLGFFQGPDITSVQISTEGEMDEKKSSGTIDIVQDNKVDLKSDQQIDDLEERLMDQVTEVKNKLKAEGYEWNIDENEEIQQLNQQIEDLKNINIQETLEKINEIDLSGKTYDLEVGTSFSIENDKKEPSVFTITAISNQWVVLNNWQTLTLQEFLSAFYETKAKRFSKVTNSSNLVDDITIEIPEWKEYEVENGKLKHTENKKNHWYESVDYLMSDSGKDFLLINNIWNDTIDVQYWEIKRKTTDDIKNLKRGEKKDYNELSWTQTISIAEFNYHVKDWKLKPQDNNKIEEQIQEVTDRKNEFISSFFSAKSIAEILQWWKIWLDAIESILTEWRDSQASKAALAMFGWKWTDLEKELKARVQWDNKKKQDEFVTKLKDLDSSESTALILKWLKNKACPSYKIEAGMIFMYQEYGSLYTKKDFAAFRGTGLWYTAMGGRVWDELWNETKEGSKDDWGNTMPFTEEEAVYRLVNRQCRPWGYNWIERRSRLHKEIKWLWPKWISEEIEKWYGDASDTRSITDITRAWLEELKEGTFANYVWWAKKASERWWAMEDVYKMPAVVLFSWAIHQFDQRIIVKMKDMYKGSDNPIPIFEFTSNVNTMNDFSETIVEISKSLGAKYPDKYKNIASEAQKIHDNRFAQWKDVLQNRIKETEAFWDAYWEPLTRALHMVNNKPWSGCDAGVDNLVLLEAHKNPPNQILKKYYNTVRKTIAKDFDFTNKNYMDDWLDWAWITGLNTQKATRYLLETVTSWFKHSKLVNSFWFNEIIPSIESVKSSDLTDEEKQRIIFSKFQDIIAGIYEAEIPRDINWKTSARKLLNTSDLTKNWLSDFGLLHIDQWTPLEWVWYKDIETSSFDNTKDPISQFLRTKAQEYIWWVSGNNTTSIFDITTESTKEKANNALDQVFADQEDDWDED